MQCTAMNNLSDDGHRMLRRGTFDLQQLLGFANATNQRHPTFRKPSFHPWERSVYLDSVR